MRPEILFPLFAPLTALPRLGPKLATLVERVAGPRVVDLLWHLPAGLVDRRFAPAVAEAPEGAVVTLRLHVLAHEPGNGSRRPWRIRCADATGEISLVYFHARGESLQRLLPPGTDRVVSGRIERFRDEIQMTHPDRVGSPDEFERIARVEPVYGLTAGLAQSVIARAVRAALDRVPELPEWQDPAFLAQRSWPPWHRALAAAHAPAGQQDLEPEHPARARLAYDELLASQLALGMGRAHFRSRPGRSRQADGRLRRKVLDALPFALTASQAQADREILADLAAPRRMHRLLQGDVGSGKTVVGVLAMLAVVEAGGQAALIAPTEILARQHHATVEGLAQAAGVRIALLTGRDRAAPRRQLLEDLASGAVDIVVGTHALLQEDVRFHDLGLAVIDEQHRFGVDQRLALSAKGRAVDILTMSATPIPRSLLMAAYGDLDVSRLLEKPPGRRPVDTRAMPVARLDDVLEGIARALDRGAKAYWICPLIEETEGSDMAAAEARHAMLRARFGPRVGLVHGRMKPAEKDAALEGFAHGGLAVLVATTVVEVGVDVPDATIMVIEHAERFGVAQLHQLRGRVGRGLQASTCLLLYAPPLGETARARLRILRETEDGFRIAEEDLRLRGAGEVLGTRQSGLPDFRLADLTVHGDLLAAAHDDARLILERDPDLHSPRGTALRTLLYLFERDAAIRYARSG